MTANKGKIAENQALDFLLQHQLRLLAQNFHSPRGEIDLVLLEPPHTIVFVEVRLRQNNHYASAAESITRTKQQRILRTAEHYLLQHPQYQHCNLRFDVVLFAQLNQSPEWIKAAFES